MRLRQRSVGRSWLGGWLLAVVAVAAVGLPAPATGAATSAPVVPTDVRVESASRTVVNLAWTGIANEWYRIDWHEADNPASTGSKTLVYARRYPYPRPPGVNAVVTGLSPSTAYVFEVVHLPGGPGGPESAPSAPLAFTTPPYQPPEVEAELDGNDVTLTWPKPANEIRNVTVHYDVYVDGVLETRVSTHTDPVQVTVPRQTQGATHTYAVLHLGWIPPSITDPVSVSVPPSGDSTPPTAPGWVFTTGPPLDCGESPETPMFEIVEASTDDTSPPGEIRYEGFTQHPLTGELYVFNYDLPDIGSEADTPVRIRAVDAAGNRSPAVTGTLIVPDC